MDNATQRLFTAIQEDDLRAVRAALKDDADPLFRMGNPPASALDAAVEQDLPDILAAILCEYAPRDIAALTSLSGEGPFADAFKFAVAHGFPGCVTAFLDAGMDPAMRFSGGQSPLLLAASNGNDQVVEVLLGRGASVSECDAFCRRPLDMAVTAGSVTCVRLLLGHGAPLVDQGRYGPYSSPMIEAATKFGNADYAVEIIDLLHAAGALLDGRNATNGRSALGAAFQTGQPTAFAHLLKLGADPYAPADNHGSDCLALLGMGTAMGKQEYGAALQEAILARQVAMPEEVSTAPRLRM